MFTPDDVKNIHLIKDSLLNLFPSEIWKTVPIFNNSGNIFIAGGIFSALYHDKFLEWGSDIDFFVLNNNIDRNSLLEKEWKETSNSGYKSSFQTYRRDHMNLIIHDPLIFKTPDDIVNDFDYVHCQPMFIWTSQGMKVKISWKMYNAVRERKLIRTNLNKRISSNRTYKWDTRGFLE